MRRVVRYIALPLVLAFVAWCTVQMQADLSRIPLGQVMQAWQPVLIAALLSLVNYFLRSVRWQAYLRQRGHDVPFAFASLTYIAGFAFTLSPGKLGELARARYYARSGVPFEDIAAAVFMERLMDLLAIVVLSALILTAFPRYGAGLWLTALGVAAMLAMLMLLPWARIAQRSRASQRAGSRAIASLAGTLVAARSLLRPRAVFMGFAIALVAWGVEGVGLYFLSSPGLGSLQATPHGGLPVVDLPVAIGIYAVAVLAGAISFLPGGLGSTEAVMAALLSAQGFTLPAALLITMLCRVVTLWLAVALGWIAICALRRHPLPLPLS